MTDKIPIRRLISIYLGASIPKDKWFETVEDLNRQGRIDFKTLLTLFLILAERLEQYEEKLG